MISLLHRWDIQPQHRTGTRGDFETSKFMAQSIEETGIEAQIQAFPFSRRVPHDCNITIDGHAIEGVPLFDCTPTSDAGVVAPIVNVDENESIGLGTFSSSGGTRNSRDVLSRHRKTDHVGLIAVSTLESPGIALLNAESYDSPFGLPVFQVDRKYEKSLQEAADAKVESKLTVTFHLEETEATNVITKIPGKDHSLSPVVVITPKSSWWTCTAERGGGLAVWHECIHELALNGDKIKRDVIFAATTGHELGHLGLKFFIGQHPEMIKTAHAWVHLGANFVAVDSKKSMQVSDDRLLTFGQEHLDKVGVSLTGITPPGVRPGGEARDIYDGGGRYISFLGSNRWFHHPIDRLAFNINIESLVKMRRAVVEIVRDLCVA